MKVKKGVLHNFNPECNHFVFCAVIGLSLQCNRDMEKGERFIWPGEKITNDFSKDAHNFKKNNDLNMKFIIQ